EQLAEIDQLAERLLGRVVLVDERVAARGLVVADGGVILPVGECALTPRGPRLAGVGLTGEVGELDGRGGAGDRDARLERSRRLEELVGRVGDEVLVAGQLRREGRLGGLVLLLGRAGWGR